MILVVLVPVGNGYSRWSRPSDWVEVEPGRWRLLGTRRHFYGEYQCEWCGEPIVTGRFCKYCFHFVARVKNGEFGGR